VLVQTGTYLESAADVKRLVVGVSSASRCSWPTSRRSSTAPTSPRATSGTAPTRAASAELFPAVTLSVSKKPGVNAADVAESGDRTRLENLRGTVIPEGVEFTVTRNYGATATDKAQKLIGKLVFATAAVVLLVLFALGRREASSSARR
jgi:multidrug efflux pump subunit AcrB